MDHSDCGCCIRITLCLKVFISLLTVTFLVCTFYSSLKVKTGEKLNFDGYIPFGDNRYVFRISKYVILMKK